VSLRASHLQRALTFALQCGKRCRDLPCGLAPLRNVAISPALAVSVSNAASKRSGEDLEASQFHRQISLNLKRETLMRMKKQ
jgi:hypothetical protein